MKRLGTIVAVLFLLVGALPSQARAAPLNDDFADAQLLEGEFGEVPATNKKAAKEAGEPNHADNAGGRSRLVPLDCPAPRNAQRLDG